jgi:hypothetical protein
MRVKGGRATGAAVVGRHQSQKVKDTRIILVQGGKYLRVVDLVKKVGKAHKTNLAIHQLMFAKSFIAQMLSSSAPQQFSHKDTELEELSTSKRRLWGWFTIFTKISIFTE